MKYQDKDGNLKTPIMLHRVVFGSMERFHGILIEHYAGAFPAWLAPQQVALVPIADRHNEYMDKIYKKLKENGIRVIFEEKSESMNYKIRDYFQNRKVPYVLVAGDKEIESNKVAIRKRGVGQIGEMTIDEFIEKLKEEIDSKGQKEIK